MQSLILDGNCTQGKSAIKCVLCSTDKLGMWIVDQIKRLSQS